MFGSISNWDGDLFDQFNRLQRDMEDFWRPAGRPASIRAVARGSHPAINIGTTAETVEVFDIDRKLAHATSMDGILVGAWLGS